MARTKAGESRRTVRGLGEIAVRINDLDTMQRFYEEVIHLPLMTRIPNCAFFKIADGFGGHTQVLALFGRGQVLCVWLLTISECSMFPSEVMPTAWQGRPLCSLPDRQRTEVMYSPIALASHRGQPSPKVCRCAGSTYARRIAGVAILRR